VGRLKETRDQQIRQQSIRVQTCQTMVQNAQEAIIRVHNKINALKNDISQTK
jgi:hypothetical protein